MPFKQAVVLIHGIGEQRPMASLRGFARSVAKHERLFSRPDRMSQSFELRVLRSVGAEARTDFYEYYWAHKINETNGGHLLGWARSLLVRAPWRVPRHLLGLYVLTWLGLLASAFVVVGNMPSTWVGSGWEASSIVGWVFVSIGALAQGIAINYLGDAARYLSPTPTSVALRQEIRADGVRLLRALHTAGYDRIVVVGHSLGSVIGYDVLTHLWAELGGARPTPKHGPQDALARLEAEGIALARTPTEAADAERYRAMQHALFEEERALGSGFRVTDFVTLGSPLAHAAILLADDEADLLLRQTDRELPTCPPIAEHVRGPFEARAQPRFSYWPWFWKQPATSGAPKHWRLHHAALFAVVRWTNLYFPTRLGALGDVVGGPLRKVFGNGIRDVAVRSRAWLGLRARTPVCHVDYWRAEERPGPDDACTRLVEALDLARACQGCAPHTSDTSPEEEEEPCASA